LAVSLVALALGMNGALAQAAPAAKPFEPQVGQSGKDVIWVPTPQSLVDRMLDVAKVTKDDFVIDLGSGDGRTVITAAKRGVRALGIEYNPDMVELSKRNAEKEGVAGQVDFVKADLFESDFSKATVITMFLLSSINMKLRPKILDLKPGTRIVSNTFDMGDWPADQTFDGGPDCNAYCRGYFWIVPAKVEGTWKLPQGELTLSQRFQNVSGTLKGSGAPVEVTGKLAGDQITLTGTGVDLTGRVSEDGKRIQGEAGGAKVEATRTGG
jgi:hypothetical protein